MIVDAIINLFFGLLNFVFGLLPNFEAFSGVLSSIFDPLIEFINAIAHVFAWLFGPQVWRSIVAISASLVLTPIIVKTALFIYRRIKS